MLTGVLVEVDDEEVAVAVDLLVALDRVLDAVVVELLELLAVVLLLEAEDDVGAELLPVDVKVTTVDKDDRDEEELLVDVGAAEELAGVLLATVPVPAYGNCGE